MNTLSKIIKALHGSPSRANKISDTPLYAYFPFLQEIRNYDDSNDKHSNLLNKNPKSGITRSPLENDVKQFINNLDNNDYEFNWNTVLNGKEKGIKGLKKEYAPETLREIINKSINDTETTLTPFTDKNDTVAVYGIPIYYNNEPVIKNDFIIFALNKLMGKDVYKAFYYLCLICLYPKFDKAVNYTDLETVINKLSKEIPDEIKERYTDTYKFKPSDIFTVHANFNGILERPELEKKIDDCFAHNPVCLLSGAHGFGKTTFSLLYAKDKNAIFFSANQKKYSCKEMLSQIKFSGYRYSDDHNRFEDNIKIIKSFSDETLIIVDDIFYNSAFSDDFYSIKDEYNLNTKLLITTNCEVEDNLASSRTPNIIRFAVENKDEKFLRSLFYENINTAIRNNISKDIDYNHIFELTSYNPGLIRLLAVHINDDMIIDGMLNLDGLALTDDFLDLYKVKEIKSEYRPDLLMLFSFSNYSDISMRKLKDLYIKNFGYSNEDFDNLNKYGFIEKCTFSIYPWLANTLQNPIHASEEKSTIRRLQALFETHSLKMEETLVDWIGKLDEYCNEDYRETYLKASVNVICYSLYYLYLLGYNTAFLEGIIDKIVTVIRDYNLVYNISVNIKLFEIAMTLAEKKELADSLLKQLYYITDILDKNTETKAQTVELAKKLLKNPSLDKIKPTEQLFHYKTGLMYSLAFTSNSTDLKTAYDIFRDLSTNSKYSTIHKYEECRQINRKIILQERYEMFASDSGALFVNLGKNITKISEYIKLKPEECFKEAAKWYDIALKIREEKYNDNAYDNSRLKAYLRSVNSKGTVYYYMKDYRKSYELREKIINDFPLSDYEHDNEIRDLLCTFRNNTVGCFEKMIDELDSAEIEKRKHQLEEYMREILKYHRFGTLFNTASKNKTKLDDIISHHTENGTLA